MKKPLNLKKNLSKKKKKNPWPSVKGVSRLNQRFFFSWIIIQVKIKLIAINFSWSRRSQTVVRVQNFNNLFSIYLLGLLLLLIIYSCVIRQIIKNFIENFVLIEFRFGFIAINFLCRVAKTVFSSTEIAVALFLS